MRLLSYDHVCAHVCQDMFADMNVSVRTRTLLQRLHGGGGLHWDQALSLEVEDVLLLKLLHLDQLLLEGQLLTA